MSKRDRRAGRGVGYHPSPHLKYLSSRITSHSIIVSVENLYQSCRWNAQLPKGLLFNLSHRNSSPNYRRHPRFIGQVQSPAALYGLRNCGLSAPWKAYLLSLMSDAERPMHAEECLSMHDMLRMVDSLRARHSETLSGSSARSGPFFLSVVATTLVPKLRAPTGIRDANTYAPVDSAAASSSSSFIVSYLLILPFLPIVSGMCVRRGELRGWLPRNTRCGGAAGWKEKKNPS
ncbi:hypothetical protein GYMLUDRAFT_245940 [Collybiopsis luxurians FD-317 M1]|uniref:Uncharacterized protein n=1 Tax=Collybiopsis luxurians FD-317 M1 TaxID=944289 RepID=A0A0D0B5C3_9AGAR|nr:hypothetical protein GYMLUDRAFT_245940 [Collybiopsis luxurians FD-317 M1]